MITVGVEPHDLRVLIPFEAKFDAIYDLTVIDETPPTWAQVQLRIEAGDLVIPSTLLSSSGASASFGMTLTEDETAALTWRNRTARLELVLATGADPILVATGVAEVLR